ncbi:hypothetical protein BO94DRAFT_539246 [Aspergillus sclerotioniger CBS 115572]|uniref:Uncharacterized protein n=1 Tax=Aspergillus sclerotioniger CBS 115572 TaxID=1450535 RepID=A0A317VGR5_9EURO|nr:hypothetical protein BO94DRAFT_539246 [Aspergillus sclerotioniger CBS 115572]PWY72122.1 hypothetical protein BO94DRAFT_539246 [Aspergillus sclerotioniger CBS 115572]
MILDQRLARALLSRSPSLRLSRGVGLSVGRAWRQSHRSFPLVEAAVLSIPKHEDHHPCTSQAPSYDGAIRSSMAELIPTARKGQ